MSWAAYITQIIDGKADTGKETKNLCKGAQIIGEDGTSWGTSAGFALKKHEVTTDGKKVLIDEFKNLENAMKNNGNCSLPGGIYINGGKYLMTHFEDDGGMKKMYLKCTGGGACVVKTNKAYFIGTFETASRMKKEGKETSQNVGDCNSAVEDTAKDMFDSGY